MIRSERIRWALEGDRAIFPISVSPFSTVGVENQMVGPNPAALVENGVVRVEGIEVQVREVKCVAHGFLVNHDLGLAVGPPGYSAP